MTRFICSKVPITKTDNIKVAFLRSGDLALLTTEDGGSSDRDRNLRACLSFSARILVGYSVGLCIAITCAASSLHGQAFYIDAISPDLKYLVAKDTGIPLFSRQHLYFWNIAECVLVSKLSFEHGHAAVRCEKVRPDNRALIIDGDNIILYDFIVKRNIFKLSMETQLSACSFDDEGNYLLAAAFWEGSYTVSGLMSVLKPKDGSVVGQIPWRSGGVALCSFLPNSTKAIVCDLRGIVAIVNCNDLTYEEMKYGFQALPDRMAVDKGKVLLCGVGKRMNEAAVMPLMRGNKGQYLRGHKRAVIGGECMTNGGVITTDKDGVTCWWDDGMPMRAKSIVKYKPTGAVLSGLVTINNDCTIVCICVNIAVKSELKEERRAEVLVIDLKEGRCLTRLFVSGEMSRIVCNNIDISNDASDFKAEMMK